VSRSYAAPVLGFVFTRHARPQLRRLAMYFSRSSHRELLTRNLRPHVEDLVGLVVDVGGGRDSPLAERWPPGTSRVRVDISPRFGPDVLGDAQTLPIRTGVVDGVVISEVLEHVPHPQCAVDEIRRVLKPGGVLIGSVPFGIGVHADPYDYFRYTKDALELFLVDFPAVEVRAHGNHVGVAWRALSDRWHWLWLANPLVRPLVRRTNERWPVGYTFIARKAAVSDAAS
jgi:SAM-dependent methyltransferase